MKKLLSRIQVFFLTFVLLILPLSNLFTQNIKADNVWTQLTDSDFSENNNVIFEFIGFGGGLIMGTNNRVFIFGGSGVVDISSQIFDGEGVSLVNLAFNVSTLFAVTVDINSNYKLWVSPSPGEWSDATSTLEDIPGFTAVRYMGIIGGNLVFQIVTDVEENFENNIYIPSGESLVPITDSTTFENEEILPYYLEVVKAMDYLDGTAMFLVEDLQDGRYFLYTYNGESFQLFHIFVGDYFVSDIATFNNTVYAYTYINNSSPTIEYYDGLGFSAPVDTLDTQEFSGKLLTVENNLYIGTSRYDSGFSRIFRLDMENNLHLLVDHVGDISETEGLNNSYITGMSVAGPFLAVAAGFPGEGPYYPSVWLYGPGEDTPVDGDSDGVDDAVEAIGPNSGDANDDNVTDATQNNVASFVNSVTDTYSVLDSGVCGISSVEVNNESTNEALDNGFSYPVGLMNFHLVCADNEDPKAPTITQYFYGDYNPELFVLRKYNSNSHTYITVNSAVITRVTIGGLPALKVSYVVEDGGPLDMDGLVNNEITDPTGPALNSVSTPNTGIGGIQNI